MRLNKRTMVAAAILAAWGSGIGRADAPHKVEIAASRFMYSPNEITVKKGQPVVLVLRSTDVTHGLKIPDLKIDTTEVKKGQDTQIAFTPELAGQFRGNCAHFCGKGHGSMTLLINVTE